MAELVEAPSGHAPSGEDQSVLSQEADRGDQLDHHRPDQRGERPTAAKTL